MPSQISNARYGQAILESVQSGTYSDSEEIVASKLPSSALATIINLVENASEDVRVSRESPSSSSIYLTDLGLENY